MVMPFKNAAVDSRSLQLARRGYGLPARSVPAMPFILESHARCEYLGLKPFESCDYSAPLQADFRIALERNARLIAQANSVLTILSKSVSDFGSMVALTDGDGTILRTMSQSTFIEQAERVALRPGVSWAESSKGTNAVGTALILESDVCVCGDEHYLQSNHFLTCAASPILDHFGHVIGVLDATGDTRSFHRQTAALVAMSARTIENNWFRDKFRQARQLHFHVMAELLGTAEEGIIAFDDSGKVLGANREGLRTLAISASELRYKGLHEIFALSFGEIMDKWRYSTNTPLKLHAICGQDIFVRISWNEGAAFSRTVHTSCVETVAERLTLAPTLSSTKMPASPTKVIYELDELDSGDAQVRTLIGKLRQVIDKDISILIMGETGTGKEWLAKAIHQFSQRRDRPFVAINCASIPEQLIESELFGYEEGAFTGAKRKGSVGKLLQANGGTLFLDEIGDMPLALQARLLRVLQERKVVPLGGRLASDIDVNLICATHRNLRDMMAQRSFRDDLYYRINGISVKVPRLRDRSDMAALCQRLLNELSPQRDLRLQPQLMDKFLRYAWPGNLRQLNNVMRTAVIMAGDEHEIGEDHLPDDFQEELAELPERLPERSGLASPSSPGASLEQVELATILGVLEACSGNVSSASKRLNISRNTIYRRLKAAA